MDGCVWHIAVSTVEALKVLIPACNDGSIVSEVVLSMKTAYGSVDLMSGPIHCV